VPVVLEVETPAVDVAVPPVEVRLLGPVEMVGPDGQVLDVGGLKQRAVFSLLASEAGRVVSLDRLVSELWSDDPPARATASLQAYISRLRGLLDDTTAGGGRRVLQTRRPGWVLDLPVTAVDSLRFGQLVDSGRAQRVEGDLAGARALLTAALALWRGPALGGLDESFAVVERTRLEELRLVAQEELLRCAVDLGDAATAVGQLEALLVQHPYRERLWQTLVVALYRSGRQADAAAVYGRARAVLDEVGLQPGPELRNTGEQVLRQALDAGPMWAPPVEVASPPEQSDGGRLFVGRRTELSQLISLLPRPGGAGSAAVVLGDTGIGKTRLLEELAAVAAARGPVVARATCVEGEPAPAYWPVVQLLQDLAGTVGRERLAELLAAAGPLLAVLEGGATESSAVPDLARTQLFAGIVQGLAQLGSQRPLVLVVDDVQWLDPASAQLLSALVARLADSAVVVVLAARPEASASPLVLQAGRVARSVRLRLEGLALEDVAALVGNGDDPRRVLERTGGNPLFVEEVVRWAHAHGAAAAAVELPPGVQDLVRARLDRLPEQTGAVLSLAAVLGRTVDAHVLAAAACLEPREVLEALEPAVAAGLVEETDDTGEQLRFMHDVVREALSARQSASRRSQVCARAAQHLLARDLLDEAARHVLLAGAALPVDVGLEAITAAAERAAARFAHERADELFTAAHRLAERLPAGEARDLAQLALHVRLGFLRTMVSGYAAPGATEEVLRARVLLARLPVDRRTSAAVWQVVNWHTVTGRFEESLALLDGLVHGADLSDPELAVMFCHLRGTALWHLGRAAEARTQLERGVAATEGCDPAVLPVINYDPVVGCHVFAAVACWGVGDDGAADAHLVESRRRAETLGDDFTKAFVLFFGAWLATLRQDPEAAGRASADVSDLAERRGFQQYVAMGALVGGWAAAHAGRPEGTAAAPAVVEAVRGTGLRMLEHWFRWLHADGLLALHRVEEALAAAELGLAASAETGEAFVAAELHLVRAAALRRLGRRAEADDARTLAAATAERLGLLPSLRRATSRNGPDASSPC
jgi:DNA-binding SARP family transcriptional activator